MRDAGLAQHVLQLVGAVGRVDVDQDRADLGGGVLDQRPTRRSSAPRCRPGRPCRRPRPAARAATSVGPAVELGVGPAPAGRPRRPAPRGRATRAAVAARLAPMVSPSRVWGRFRDYMRAALLRAWPNSAIFRPSMVLVWPRTGEASGRGAPRRAGTVGGGGCNPPDNGVTVE